MIWKGRLLTALLFSLHPASLLAAEGSIASPGGIPEGQLTYSLYAPDWIWQGQRVNVLIVLENQLASTATVKAAIEFPPPLPPGDSEPPTAVDSEIGLHGPGFPYFAYDGSTSQTVAIGPGETRRIAFANLLARNEIELAGGTPVRLPTGRDLPFRIDLSAQSPAGEATATASFAVRTVRGGAVPEGLWATWLPVALILLWCALIFLIVPRMAKPGAWRKPSEPIDTNGS